MKCYDIVNYCPFVKVLYGSCVKAGARPRKAGLKVTARVIDNQEVLERMLVLPRRYSSRFEPRESVNSSPRSTTSEITQEAFKTVMWEAGL